MSKKLEFFDIYTNRFKWQVTPIAVNSKAPILKDWNKKYDKLYIRNLIEENPDYNLGLCLGKIVDVEADTPEANKTLTQMLGDYPHPQYRSSRSVHHLFLTPDPKLTKVIVEDIEFRGHKHQSLLPPSTVGNVDYKWINAEFPIPPLPKSLLKFYWKFVRRFVRPAEIWTCKKCKKKCIIETRPTSVRRKSPPHECLVGD